MSGNKDKIVKGLSDALGFAKGADNGERITIYSATEFYLGGVRFNPGSYQIKKVLEVGTAEEPTFEEPKMPDLTQKDLWFTNLHGLEAVVQYMGANDRPDVSPTTWRTMAAFDSMSMAEKYVEGCKSEIWQYRAVAISEEYGSLLCLLTGSFEDAILWP